MNTILQDFERLTGLTVAQAAKLLAVPAPTYYQYRRTGKVPDHMRRTIDIISRSGEPLLSEIISEYVFDGL